MENTYTSFCYYGINRRKRMGICRWGTRIRIKLYIDIRFISLAFKKISDKRMWKEAFNDYFNDTRYGYETTDKYIVENKKSC